MFKYEEAVKADVLAYINENYTAEELEEKLEDKASFAEELNDTLWIEDGVTGNASGSYTFNNYKAKEFVYSDTETVQEAIEEFGIEANTIAEKFLASDWEYFDVIARCYCLSGAIFEALETLSA